MTIRIFHVSDFHLNKKNLSDWNDFLKEAFINFINANKGEVNFIVCTGDMVDKGGADFGGIKQGFEKFKESVILPIIDRTRIPIDQFILAPGNHDIYREADPDYTRGGIRDIIKEKGTDKINEYTSKLIKDKGEPSKRIEAYYEFTRDIYKDISNVTVSYLGAVYNYNVADRHISFSSFNTVWNCCDDSDRDFGLAIGEPQYLLCRRQMPEDAIKIAIMHHPLDWLIYEKQSVQSWLRNDFDLLLMGHVHENDTLLTKTPAGSMILNFAPSFTNDIRKPSLGYVNGFTMIDYDVEEGRFDFQYERYDHKSRSYTLNHDYEEDGHFYAKLSEGTNDRLAQLMNDRMSYLKIQRVPEINGSIIPQKAQAINTLDEAFVLPPIRKNGEFESKEDISLSSIMSKQDHVVLFGQNESGKSTILKKILLEFVANENIFGVLPIYYDFNVQTYQDIETIIKAYIDCNSSEVKLLLENKKIVLLVDNYNPRADRIDQAKKLYRFAVDNSVRVIATSSNEIPDNVPEVFISYNELAFEYYFIHQFCSSNIKELISKWSPDLQILERNRKIEDMVNRFCSFSLPCTAMSVSLYLWSTENSNREPVNPSILLDIYMEIILEKMAVDNIYVKTFDYNNKASLLAYLAQSIHDDMHGDATYTLTYGHYISKIEDYIKLVGFEDIDAKRLGQYFIERKVFVLVNGNVEFAHACFYYFFLAKRMVNNFDFREKILQKDTYYKYDRVIEYYSGLVRSDKALMEFLYEDFEQVFNEVAFIYDEVDIDKCFTIIRKDQKSYIPFIQSTSPKQIAEQKPTEEEVETKVLLMADKKLSQIKDRFLEPQRLSPIALVLLLSRALRNLDGVEDVPLKQKVYNALIKNAIILTVITKDHLALYANNHKGQLPAAYNDIKNVGFFLRFMPLGIQETLGEIMSTRKLVNCFRRKYQQDKKNKVSDIEKFLSIGMMWDCTGLDNKQFLKAFIREVGNNSVQDYILFKLLYYYNNKVALGSREEDDYIDLIVELKAKQRIIDRFRKGLLKKEMKDARNKKMLENKRNEMKE